MNLTREAYNKAQKVKLKNADIENVIIDAERACKKTEALINRYNIQFTQGLQENDNNLQALSKFVNMLESQIPTLNQEVRVTNIFLNIKHIKKNKCNIDCIFVCRFAIKVAILVMIYVVEQVVVFAVVFLVKMVL